MRRRALFIGLALALLSGGAAHAQADWPAGKTIKIIVPFPPGGTVDIVTRLLTQPLGAALNTSVIIENKPGAGTNIGTELVARAAPDGLTLLMGGVPNAINETLYPNLNFNLRRDLVGVTLVASLPNVLVVNPNVPAKTLAEFIALNKAKPGTINFASGGIGTTPHLCAVMFGMAIDAPVTHVPYRGSAPASQDLVGRTGAGDVRFGRLGAAADPGRQAAPARRHRPGARCPPLRRSHHGRGRREGFRRHLVVGTDGAGRDAARHRAEDRDRGGQDPREPRSPENSDRARLRDAGRRAAGVREISRRRYRVVGEGGAAVRRDGELIGLRAMPMMPTSRTIPRLLDELAAKHPGPRGAGRRRRSATPMRRCATKCAPSPRACTRSVSRKGDKVAILMGNKPEWIIADLAICLLGGVMVAVNTWVTSRELQHILAHSDATMLIASDRYLKYDYFAMLEELEPLAQVDAAAAARRACRRAAVSRFDRVPGRVRAGRDVADAAIDAAAAAVDPRDVAYILYTSGSTSTPKGVQLQHYALIENMWHIGDRMHVTEHDRLWLAVSLFWGLGCENALFNLMTHGGCVVLQESFEPGEALRLIAPSAARSSTACPTWCRRSPSIRTGANYDISGLRAAARSARPSSCSASSISA